MTLITLLAQNGTAGTIGAPSLFATGENRIGLQFNPQSTVGFSGTLIVEGSNAGQPGANDWVELASVVFSAHTQNFAIDMFTDTPWMRVRIAAGTSGAVSVYASV